jgi:hypothetical protein
MHLQMVTTKQLQSDKANGNGPQFFEFVLKGSAGQRQASLANQRSHFTEHFRFVVLEFVSPICDYARPAAAV